MNRSRWSDDPASGTESDLPHLVDGTDVESSSELSDESDSSSDDDDWVPLASSRTTATATRVAIDEVSERVDHGTDDVVPPLVEISDSEHSSDDTCAIPAEVSAAPDPAQPPSRNPVPVAPAQSTPTRPHDPDLLAGGVSPGWLATNLTHAEMAAAASAASSSTPNRPRSAVRAMRVIEYVSFPLRLQP